MIQDSMDVHAPGESLQSHGTAHFEKQALVDYIERTGMRFGAHLNAYTSFD